MRYTIEQLKKERNEVGMARAEFFERLISCAKSEKIEELVKMLREDECHDFWSLVDELWLESKKGENLITIGGGTHWTLEDLEKFIAFHEGVK